MYKPRPESLNTNKSLAQNGQALIEYALITVLVGIAFGLAMAASAPVTGNLFNAVVNDLLRQTVVGEVPNPDEFWGTVTGVFQYTPTGAALPTNTPAPDTAVPTAGPSPTPSLTYTPTTEMPSSTPPPTRTPVDVLKSAPFLDTVDEPKWWRIDSNFHLDGHPWNVEAWNNTTPDDTPDFTKSGVWELKFNGGPFFEGVNADNFSARFTRTIEIKEPSPPKVVNFRVIADDGVEMSLNGAPISLTNGSGQNASLNGNNLDLYTGTATLPVGTHTVVVLYKASGGASSAILNVDIVGGGANPDDTAIDGSGNAAGGEFSCNWGALQDANDSNTEARMFDDYVGGQNRAGTLCYLEFRGAVVIPDDATDMQLHFWDVWEFDDGGADGWIEVAQYVPTSTTPTVNRDAFNWQRINLGRTGTKNFNWTHNVIDLQTYMAGWTGPKYLAFRFAMQVPQGVADGVGRQWLIDDIEFKRKTEKVFTVDRIWTLNNADERFDFIRTGGTSNSGLKSGWHLVSNNKFGPNGLAFHDSANDNYDDAQNIAWANGTQATRYKRMNIGPATSFESDVRINSLEFDGWIDLSTVPATDSFGNTGEPVLSFYHAYHLGTRTGLSVQYSTSPYGPTPAEWHTFPNGELRDVTESTTATSLTMQEEVISLMGLPGNPQRIRIRFAMLIHKQADNIGDGWWIDQIRLGRAESNKWLNYPFFDDAQAQQPLYFWRYTGAWAPTTVRGHYRTNAVADDVEMSYASSPQSNYANDQTSYMTMRWPIDLYNDTPEKQVIVEAGALSQPSNTFGAPATANSVLTFYHWRELERNDDFIVEWKRASEPDSAYRMLWLYRYSMNTSSTGSNAKTGMNKTWQYTRVSMYPIFRQFAIDNNGAPGVGSGTQLTDDDIMIRFGLKADGSQNASGIFVDDIQIEESTMRTVRLWPTSQNRVDPSLPVSPPPPLLGNGTGSYFYSEPDGTSDGRAYTLDWKMGGQWQPQRFEKRKGSGLFAFHDSVRGGQEEAPSGYHLESGSDDFGDSAWYTRHQTFSVLDLNREFDLRAVDAETESPQLSFWTRYHIGEDDYIRVQISQWDSRTDSAIDSSMSARCANQPVLQCYEQERGWGQWTNIWSVGSNSSPTLSYGWRKISVDLRPYAYSAASGTQGKKIRIRFVYDAYDTEANYDGWYIDGVEVAHRLPLPMTAIGSTIWIDQAVSTANWITEGSWGLDENIFIASASAPVNLGEWTGRWWHCPSNSPTLAKDCEQLGANAGYSGGNRFKEGANIFLQNPARPDPDRIAYDYSTINLNFGGGSPFPGWSPNNEILGEFTLEINVDGITFQPGKRSFSTRSDDGVRMKIEEYDQTTGELIPNAPFEWNIIDNWTDHSATTDSGITSDLMLGKRYRLTLQYYEKSGDGVIQMIASTGSFSYSDSPKVTGGGTPDVPPIPRANTSLLGRHIFDLNGFDTTNIPVLEIHTKYRIRGSASANVEVSSDGGFTWSQTNLSKDAFGVNYSGATWDGVSSGFDNQPDSSAWQVRQFNLNSFEGRHVIIRMRFDRLGTSCYRNNNPCHDGPALDNPTLALKDGYYDGWWIGFMRMGKVGE